MTLCALLLLATAVAPPPLTVAFFPAPGEPGPTVLIEASEGSAGKSRVRRARVAVLDGATASGASFEDESAAPREPGFPGAPTGLALRVAPDGALLITVDDAGAWQKALKDSRRGGIRGEGVLVSSDETLRLSVEPPPEYTCFGRGCSYTSPAQLVGTRASVRGLARVIRGPPPPLLITDGRDIWQPTSTTHVLALHATCGGRAPKAVVALDDLADHKLSAPANALCDPWIVSALTGQRVEATRSRAIQAISISAR